MNRRTFLRRALTGVAVVAVASKMPLSGLMSAPTSAPATIAGYSEYSNFSILAISQSIDEIVQKSAVELGYRAGQSIDELYAMTLDGTTA